MTKIDNLQGIILTSDIYFHVHFFQRFIHVQFFIIIVLYTGSVTINFELNAVAL